MNKEDSFNIKMTLVVMFAIMILCNIGYWGLLWVMEFIPSTPYIVLHEFLMFVIAISIGKICFKAQYYEEDKDDKVHI